MTRETENSSPYVVLNKNELDTGTIEFFIVLFGALGPFPVRKLHSATGIEYGPYNGWLEKVLIDGGRVKDSWTLEDLYRSIARGWRVLVSMVAISVLASVGLSFLWPVQYEATAVLTVEPIAVNPSGNTTGSVNMDTERVVATSTEVLDIAASSIPGSTVQQLKESTVVSVPKGSQVLSFTVTSVDPALASASANEIANAYSDRRIATAQEVVNDAVDNLVSRIQDLTEQMSALPEGSAAVGTLTIQIQALQERQAALSSATFYSGSLVSPAVTPSSSAKPSITVFLAAGLALGLFLGVFVALAVGSVRLRPQAHNQREQKRSVPQKSRVTETPTTGGSHRGAGGDKTAGPTVASQSPNSVAGTAMKKAGKTATGRNREQRTRR